MGYDRSAGSARLLALASRIAEIEPSWLPIAGHVRNVTFTLNEADMVIAALAGAPAQGSVEISQHIGWLKQYMDVMNENNWRDMRMLAKKQLERFASEIAAQPPAAPVEMFKCNCPHETRSGCSEPKCPHYDSRYWGSRSSAVTVETLAEAIWKLDGPVYSGWPASGERVPLCYKDQYGGAWKRCERIAAGILAMVTQPQGAPETFRGLLETAYRRSGGIPAIARSEHGARKIIDIAVAEYATLTRPQRGVGE